MLYNNIARFMFYACVCEQYALVEHRQILYDMITEYYYIAGLSRMSLEDI